MLDNLLKYDSAQGRYALADKVEARESSIVVAGNDLPTIVYGVNENILKKNDRVISAASCTTIHTYTGDPMTLDGPDAKGNLRKARAAL